jgi:hypothetical protein
MRSQFATSSKRKIKYQPLVFTEQGVIMLSSVLNIPPPSTAWKTRARNPRTLAPIRSRLPARATSSNPPVRSSSGTGCTTTRRAFCRAGSRCWSNAGRCPHGNSRNRQCCLRHRFRRNGRRTISSSRTSRSPLWIVFDPPADPSFESSGIVAGGVAYLLLHPDALNLALVHAFVRQSPMLPAIFHSRFRQPLIQSGVPAGRHGIGAKSTRGTPFQPSLVKW